MSCLDGAICIAIFASDAKIEDVDKLQLVGKTRGKVSWLDLNGQTAPGMVDCRGQRTHISVQENDCVQVGDGLQKNRRLNC